MSVIKLTELISKTASFARYLLTAKHRKGNGIHSPFTFDLIANVLYDRQTYKEYAFLSGLRMQLKNTNAQIQVENFGASSKKFKQNHRKISDLVRISSVNEKYGRLLFRLSKFYHPNHILELGTSIGLASAYLSTGCSDAKVITIEGNESLYLFAKKIFMENGLQNIDARRGLFDELLPDVLSGFSNHSLIFIDGNHRYEPTVRYFKSICSYLDECMIVFDDINWSPEMQKAWKEISADPLSHVTIDLYSMGIVIRDKNITPGNYTVWF